MCSNLKQVHWLSKKERSFFVLLILEIILTPVKMIKNSCKKLESANTGNYFV